MHKFVYATGKVEKKCVTYFGCVFVSLVIPHVIRMLHIVNSGLLGLFLQYVKKGTFFLRKRVLFLYNFF